MTELKTLNIENYLLAENNEVKVGSQLIGFTCDDEGYPFHYEVTVTVDGRWKKGTSTQITEWDSAFHDGFVPAYKMACARLGVKPIFI